MTAKADLPTVTRQESHKAIDNTETWLLAQSLVAAFSAQNSERSGISSITTSK